MCVVYNVPVEWRRVSVNMCLVSNVPVEWRHVWLWVSLYVCVVSNVPVECGHVWVCFMYSDVFAALPAVLLSLCWVEATGGEGGEGCSLGCLERSSNRQSVSQGGFFFFFFLFVRWKLHSPRWSRHGSFRRSGHFLRSVQIRWENYRVYLACERFSKSNFAELASRFDLVLTQHILKWRKSFALATISQYMV